MGYESYKSLASHPMIKCPYNLFQVVMSPMFKQIQRQKTHSLKM